MKDFVTVEEVAELEGISVSTMKRYIKMGAYFKTRLTDSVSANGGRKILIDVRSLSMNAQIKYFDIQAGRNAPSYDRLNKAGNEARREALRILPIVRGAAEIQEGYRVAGRRDDLVERLSEHAKRNETTLKTLYRWMADYKKEGFVGLISKNGIKRESRLNPRITEVIQSAWLQSTRPSQQDIFKKITAFCSENLLSPPSYKTVQRIINKIPEAVVTYHRIGGEAWLSDNAPKAVRDMNRIAINDWWNSDHREFDLFVQVGNKVLRPWLTTWMDMRSRKAVSRTISFNPNSRTVAVSFRQAVMTHGRPKHIYKDNGKDYSCHYLNGKTKRTGKIGFDEESKGVFSLLNVQVHNAIPYAAWSKPIERWHRNITTWERTLPGWCGKDNKERPEKLPGEIRGGKLLTLEEFTLLFDQWLDEYNNTFHSGINCSPNELWNDSKVAMEIPEERALDLLLMKHERRKVNPSGIKVFPGRWHYAPKLAYHIGSFVTVRYDPNEVGHINVFLEGGEYLCTAIERTLLKMGASEEALKANAKERADARRRVKQYPKDLYTLSDNDTLLAQIIEDKKRLRAEDKNKYASKPSKPAEVVRLVTKFDGQAKEIDSAPPADEDFIPPAEQADIDDVAAYDDMRDLEFIEMRRKQDVQKKQDEEERMRVFHGSTGADLND